MRRIVALASLFVVAACGAEAAGPRSETPPVASEPQPVTEAAPQPEVAKTRGTVVLVPLGSFPDDLLDTVEQGLRDEYDVEVERRDPVALPQRAYYKPRKRYRAEKLLDYLHEVVPEKGERLRVLGLTTVDISTTKGKYKDWGIFGYGELPGKTSVLSMYRLKRKAKDRDHLKFRVATVALHEIGHTFGLDHCGEKRCVMQDAEGSIANTDSSSGELEAGCRAKLEREYPLIPKK